jgi:hypothetical protein
MLASTASSEANGSFLGQWHQTGGIKEFVDGLDHALWYTATPLKPRLTTPHLQ